MNRSAWKDRQRRRWLLRHPKAAVAIEIAQLAVTAALLVATFVALYLAAAAQHAEWRGW